MSAQTNQDFVISDILKNSTLTNMMRVSGEHVNVFIKKFKKLKYACKTKMCLTVFRVEAAG